MLVNNVIISEEKMAALSNVLPESLLRDEYELSGLSDIEISQKHGMSVSWVNKLRRIYGIKTDERYQLRRNALRLVDLSDRQKKVLHGTLFGDSCIAVQDSGTGYWRCRHCIQQEQLLLKKAAIFSPYVAKVFYGERAFEKGGELFKYVDGRTFALPQFTEYRNRFYPEGKKVLTLELLRELTPEGFAYWWMDDGLKTEYGFNIVTYDKNIFEDQKIEATKAFKEVFNLSVSITWYEGEGNICILKDSHNKAWEYIAPEITNDLIYKLPKKYRNKDNQQPSLDGNVSEGSTTGESLSAKAYDGNSHLEEATLSRMPGTCEEQVVIQSELVGNCKR